MKTEMLLSQKNHQISGSSYDKTASSVSHMKKWPVIIVIASAVVLAIILLILVLFLKSVNPPESNKAETLEEYFSNNWTAFSFESFDSQSGEVILSKTFGFSFDAFQKTGYVFDEVVDGHRETIKEMMDDCLTACKTKPLKITIVGYSSDNRQVYAIDSTGAKTVCWKTAK